jgi:multimeric flavodoxin WrbA
MKEVLVLGSPRLNGNTQIIISEIERGLKDRGFETKKFILHEMDVRYCMGCKSCYTTGECVHNDDVIQIVQEIFDAQLVIVASPSYWGDVTAQLKTFIDRCTPYCDTNEKRKLFSKNTKGVAVAVRAGGNRSENENLVKTIEHFLGHLNIPFVSSLTAEGINTIDDLISRPELLREAYNFGSTLKI